MACMSGCALRPAHLRPSSFQTTAMQISEPRLRGSLVLLHYLDTSTTRIVRRVQRIHMQLPEGSQRALLRMQPPDLPQLRSALVTSKV